MVETSTQHNSPRLEKFRKKIASLISEPIVNALSKSGVTPDMLTWFGFILMLVAAGLVAWNYWIAGGLVLILGGSFDMLDGALARKIGSTSKFGAVLDSTLDRASEGILLIALAFHFSREESVAGVTLAAVVMLFSFLVSYIRSKAECINIECREGLFTRTERVIVLAVGLVFNQIIIALAIVAFFSVITVIQRLVLVWQKTRAG